MSSEELCKSMEVTFALQNLTLEATKMAIYNLELSILIHGAQDRRSVEASHRLRDIVGPMKHG